MRIYWKHLTESHQVAYPFSEPPTRQPSDAPNCDNIKISKWLGEAVTALQVLDTAYHVGLIYTALLPARYRTKNGVYYTPPALANRLLDQGEAAGLDWTTCRVLDPACGGCAFLAPAAVRMVNALRGSDPAIVLQNLGARLLGWEIDPYAAWLTRFFIEAACLPVSAAAGRRMTPNVVACDSLRANHTAQAFDFVVGNPPFGRLKLSHEMRSQYRRGLYGHANIYGLFTELAVRLAKPGGLVAFITPASFLSGEYFKNLRALLWEDAPPVALDFVESRKNVFDGVLQETVSGHISQGGKTATGRGLYGSHVEK